MKRRTIGRLAVGAAMAAAAGGGAPVETTGATSQPERAVASQPKGRDKAPTPPQRAAGQQMVAEAIGGGFVAMGVRREPIWIGRLRDSGRRSRPCSRRAGRGRR